MRQKKYHLIMRYLVICLPTCCLLLLLAGCNRPKISFTAKTEIHPNGQTARAVVITCKASKKNETAPNLTDYLRLPEVKKYQRFSPLADGVAFSGIFNSTKDVPVDFMKLTTGFEIWAHNRLRLRRNDYVLLSTFEFEERVEDIVERPEAEEALAQGIGLISEAFISGFDACYGKEYDLSRLDAYLRNTLPELSRRLYQALWEIRRSKRAGLDMEMEVQEWDRRLRQELSNYGIYLSSLTSSDARKTNEARAWEFLDTKLRELVIPRQPETPPLRAEIFRNIEKQQELLKQIELAINESFGSMEFFIKQIDPLIPVIFGAFFEQRLLFNHAEPEFLFHFQLYLPGHIMQTNGVRDLNGSIHWRFRGEDLHLTGYPMWVRSVGVNLEKTERLGLFDFPGDLTTVDLFIRSITNAGAPNRKLLAILEKCVEEKSLAALREATSDQKARELLQVLEGFLLPKEMPDNTSSTTAPDPFEEFSIPVPLDPEKDWGYNVEMKPFNIDDLISIDLEMMNLQQEPELDAADSTSPTTDNSSITEKTLAPTLDDLD